LAPLIASSRSFADLCRKLGIKPSTGAQTHLSRRVQHYGINTDHFVGRNWALAANLGPRRPISDYLDNKVRITSSRLKKRLISDGLKKAECEGCLLTHWLGEPIPLELHHIDSDHDNNALLNLQVLCPNCHGLEKSGRGGTADTEALGASDASRAGSNPAARTIMRIASQQRPEYIRWKNRQTRLSRPCACS
jgi:hypothetical protein